MNDLRPDFFKVVFFIHCINAASPFLCLDVYVNSYFAKKFRSFNVETINCDILFCLSNPKLYILETLSCFILWERGENCKQSGFVTARESITTVWGIPRQPPRIIKRYCPCCSGYTVYKAILCLTLTI